MRGTINWLVRQGARLLDATTADRAADHVINLMSIRDVEDATHVRRIATEQQQAISVARRIQRGEIVGNLSQIPTSSTFRAVGDDRVRYLFIVKLRDGISGEMIESRQEILSDVPILYSDVRQEAISRAFRDKEHWTPKGGVGDDENLSVSSVVLLSVTRAG